MSFLASTALAALVVGSSFAMPFGASVSSGGREHSAVSAQRVGDGRFSLSFENGGEVVFSEVPMSWGTRYTVDKVAVPGAKSIRFAIVRAPWATERSTFANLLADGRRAVCLRAYDVPASMHCKGDSLWLECDDVRSLVGVRFAVAEGPVDGFREPHTTLTFLGYEFRMVRDRLFGTGKRYLTFGPSKKSMKRVREKIHGITHARNGLLTVEKVVERLNKLTKGWGAFYSVGYPSKAFNAVNGYALRRMARFLNRKSQRHYRLKFADTYYGELNHYGMHWLRWAEVRRRRY